MWVPYTESLLKVIPPEAIIHPVDDIQRLTLSSLRTREIETPAKAIAEIAKAYYFRTIMSGGKWPQTLKFETGQLTAGSSDEIEWLNQNLQSFMNHWRNPGFTFRDKEKFFVRRSFLDQTNYLNLSWHFSGWFQQERTPLREEWEEWVSKNLSHEDLHMEALSRVLMDPTGQGIESLPPVVRDRLPQFMESDSFVLFQVDRQHVDARDIILVSKDRKLAAQVVRLARRHNKDSVVWLLDPMIFEYGRLWEETVDVTRLKYRAGQGIRRFPGLDSCLIIQDPGSILWNVCNSGATDADGISTDLGVEYFIRPIIAEQTRFDHVYDVVLDWKASVNTSSLGW